VVLRTSSHINSKESVPPSHFDPVLPVQHHPSVSGCKPLWTADSPCSCQIEDQGTGSELDRHQLLAVFRHHAEPSRFLHSVMRWLATACLGGSQTTGGSPNLGGVFTCKAQVISSGVNQRASSSSERSTSSCVGTTAGHMTSRTITKLREGTCESVWGPHL